MPDQMTTAEFAQAIKAKYPDYASVPDDVLAAKMLEKYPEYKPQIQEAPAASPAARFVEGAWKNLNPISAVQGLAHAALHPIDTASNILSAQGAELGKARDLVGQGRYVEAVGHAGAAALPVLGPMAAQAGERIASGDVAGGLGEATGLIAPFGAADAAKQLGKAWGVMPKTTREVVADRLQHIASEKVADVMAPKVGANKVRFGNAAAKVAPDLLERGDVQGFSREALQGHIEGKLAEASAALDTAADARNPKQVVYTGPILSDLNAAKAKLTAQTHAIGPMKAGESVVPSPNAARAATIDQAIDEIKQLGPVANYEALRRIRQAYDGPASAVYNPSMTQDFLKAQGGKLGAADVTGTLREHLAKFDPQTAAANADYSLYRKASDVLTATEEIQRTRPKVGRQIIARFAGGTLGLEAAGLPGAAAGVILGPVLDQALNSGVTTKLQTAKLLNGLSDAIRNGDIGAASSFAARLKVIARTSQAGVSADRISGSTVPASQPATP